MTQPRRMVWLAIFILALLSLPTSATAQSGRVTNEGFLPSNSTTQQLNLNGQGISLMVAGSSATVGKPAPIVGR